MKQQERRHKVLQTCGMAGIQYYRLQYDRHTVRQTYSMTGIQCDRYAVRQTCSTATHSTKDSMGEKQMTEQAVRIRTGLFQYSREGFRRMMTGVVGMGVTLSFLLNTGYGTDPCSFLNNALSVRFGIPMGTVMVLVHLLFFIPELIWGRKYIGIGTVCNMVMIGYISDFCRYLWSRLLPETLFLENPGRPLTFAAALAAFLVFAALYMNADLGQAPYDSISSMISDRVSIPYFLIRMVWDFLIIGIAMLAGAKLTVCTVLMALLLGPTVSRVGKMLRKRSEGK